MGRTLFQIDNLLTPLEDGAWVLTPNHRLKNKILAAYHLQQPAGLNRWRAPNIHSVDEWLQEAYWSALDQHLLPSAPTLISDQAAQQLWLQIINEHTDGAELINPLRLASDAHNAYQVLLRWQLEPAQLTTICLEQSWHYDSPFPAWAERFEEALKARQLMTKEHLQQHLVTLAQTNKVARLPELILLGFDDCPPLQRCLFANMADHYQFLPANDTNRQPDGFTVTSYPNVDDEIRAAALWSESIIQQDSDATIGIICPNLGQVRQRVEHIFTEVLESHYALPDTSRYTLPFNFSAGVPLGSTALINDALTLLQLNHQDMEQETLQSLFNSPFWIGGEHLHISTVIQRRLQRANHRAIRLSQLRRWVNECAFANEEHEPAPDSIALDLQAVWQELDRRLQDIESLRRQFGKQHLPSVWLELFEKQLRSLGWPGERRLDSNEFQQMNQWYQLLDQFCQLDNLGQSITCHKALELLNQAVGQTHFQAQTPESPIQVLGILEGAGLDFSHVWMLGMSQHQWPPTPSPNPLLPIPLQRQQKMPHADADRELDYARSILQNYQHGSRYWVASYAQYDEDRPQQASPLLTALSVPRNAVQPDPPKPSELSQNDWQTYQERLAQTQSLQWLNTGTAPAVSDNERQHLKGGSQIFRHQALLPYAAFLIHRLQAQDKRTPSLGFSPIERGQILHDSLSVLWKNWRTQAQLLTLTDQQLDQALSKVIGDEIQRYQRREPHIYGNQYCALELQRQKKLITHWLQLERERPEFEVVANEETLAVEFAGIALRLRLDRMDRLSSGELIVIDYKTGTPTAKQWGGDRPEEPQLPLYCLCYQQDINAIMFAQINAKDITMKGLGELSLHHEGIQSADKGPSLQLPDDWESIKAHWQKQLSLLADEFLQGDTNIDLQKPQVERFYEHLDPIVRRAEQEDIVRFYRQPEDRA